jgi:hypothetical protein
MKILLIAAIAAIAATMALPTYALEIATGKAGGDYDTKSAVISENLRQRGIENHVTNYNGSSEISLTVCQGKADVGLMQMDAIYVRMIEDKCVLKPIAPLGDEVAVMLVPGDAPKAKRKLKNWTDSDSVLVDTVGSGSELWWKTAVSIEQSDKGSQDDWAKASTVNDSLDLAEGLGSMGNITGVVMVRKQNSKDIINLLDAGWQLAELWDKNLDDLKFNGKPMYEQAELTIVDSNGKKHSGWGYKVKSFVAANSKLTDHKITGAIASSAK